MSEYQYYEFQAIDCALDAQGQEALRALSTRARITPTSFTNSYEWGDFKGDAWTLMANWFDLHLYLANWGSRRLMIRWPAKSLDHHLLDAFLGEVDQAEVREVGHLRHRLRSAGHIPKFQPRTVGELRARAKKLRRDRERAQTEKAAIDRKRREEEAEQARRTRLDAIARRGESVWREIETEIERRNAAGYARAANLLLDLKTISSEKSALEGFTKRLLDIRRRHAQKARLMERSSKLG